jgi:hypothetical protein
MLFGGEITTYAINKVSVFLLADEEDDSDVEAPPSNLALSASSPTQQTSPTPARTSSSNIHLWQFVKVPILIIFVRMRSFADKLLY